jgi:hypothetical protein
MIELPGIVIEKETGGLPDDHPRKPWAIMGRAPVMKYKLKISRKYSQWSGLRRSARGVKLASGLAQTAEIQRHQKGSTDSMTSKQ